MGLQWNEDPETFIDVVLDGHKRACEKVALEVYSRVIDLTPVYSGSLRASWNISHTVPNYSYVTGGHPSNPLSPPQVPTSLEGLPRMPTIHIANGTPYASYVNDGGPNNVPVHMVELALESVK